MNFARTLIIKPSSMGDVVQALPVLTALKEAHPAAHVSWLVGKSFAGILEGHPRLDEVIVFDRQRFGTFTFSVTVAGEFLAFMKSLRQRRFTTVIDLQGLLRSGLLALATGAPSRVGFRDARELAPLFYTAEVFVPRRIVHAVDRYLAVAQRLGLAGPRARDHLPVSTEARAAIRRRLAEAGLAPGEPFVAVGPHARWPTKEWPAERFAAVVEMLGRYEGARAVLVGSRDAADAARLIARGLAEPPIDLTNRTTLKELAAVLAEARVMLTNDSGPMHVAAAVGTPVVAIFGPTNPARTGPYGPGHRILAGRAACSPCYRRQCLYDRGNAAMLCLTNITPEAVYEQLSAAWRDAGPA
ncbi:MAG: lipopolysaccharide heptosyltransferase I [Planctomycetes bacterium]|nr:lipopolysaccharide heptosyltransferase I [Planctomycetota bacterium]